MTELLTSLLVVGGFLAFCAWLGFGIRSEVLKNRRRVSFKEGTYKPAESQLVRMKLENIQNYNLPRAFADISKFTCAICCCHKLDLTHKSTKIINRIKDEVRDDILKIMRSIKLIDKDWSTYHFYDAQYMFPTESTNIQFQYLSGACHGCKKYVDDFNISGGKCGEQQAAPVCGDDVT